MIYKREEFVEENPESKNYPVKQVEVLSPLGDGKKRHIGRVSLALQTPMGLTTMPISFEIPADTVEEAFRKFDSVADAEVEAAKRELQEQLQELRRKAQSRIITPGELPPNIVPPGGAPGGSPRLKL